MAITGCGNRAGGDDAKIAALRAGGEAALPCQERFHEEVQTYADCVRYIANRLGGRTQGTGAAAGGSVGPQAPLQRLGALTLGWTRADPLGLMGDADAHAAARELIGEAAPLQAILAIPDEVLAGVSGMPVANFAARKHELLAADPSDQITKPSYTNNPSPA